MSDGELYNLVSKLDQATLCKYCNYKDDCDGETVCYDGATIFPPCQELSADDFFDYESYLADADVDVEG